MPVVDMDDGTTPSTAAKKMRREPQEVASPSEPIVGAEPGQALSGEEAAAVYPATISQIIASKLCPKQDRANITEFVALAKGLRKAVKRQWAAKRVMVLFLVLRGIRGDEGVKKAIHEIFLSDCDLESEEHIRMLGERLIAIYESKVSSGSKPRSFMCHNESWHVSFSGIHFLKSLLLDEQRVAILQLAGRLVPFWEKATTHTIRPEDLAPCHEIFERSRLIIKASDKTEKVCRLNKNSYNTMDFMRAFCSAWEAVLEQPAIIPTEHFWTKMLAAQRDKPKTKAMLCEFGLEDYEQVKAFLQQHNPLTWVTLLVFLCEVRQTRKNLAGFDGLVRKVLANPAMLPEIHRATAEIVKTGATRGKCYCTRLCLKVMQLSTANGDDID